MTTMTKALTKPAAPALNVVDGIATVSSIDVAKHFGKQHKNVLRDIEALKPFCDAEFHRLNFEPMIRSFPIGKGATNTGPTYNLSRDGFALLAMGFTGEKAIAFKVAYIKAFNSMEAQLSSMYVAPLTGDREFRKGLKFNDRLKLQEMGQKIARQLDKSNGPAERSTLFWQLRQVNDTLGIPTPSMEALGIGPGLPALKGPTE